MMSDWKKYLRSFKRYLSRSPKRFDNIKYWKRRAKEYGSRAVVNLGHDEAEYKNITEKQKQILFPLLKSCLNGTERIVLDFGCGPGRFTRGVAITVGGKCYGVDPTQGLLDLSQKHDSVEFLKIEEGNLPFDDSFFDVVWCCIVLGGLKDRTLMNSTAEIERVLRNGGLLFLVENTTTKADVEHWSFRSVDEYRNLFKNITLSPIGSYEDLSEEITVMAGRKKLNSWYKMSSVEKD